MATMRTSLFVLLVMLQVVDVISTRIVLARGGVERNPVVLWLMECLGPKWWIPKVALVIMAGAACWQTQGAVGLVGLVVLVALYCWVAVQNLRAMRRADS